MLQKIIYVLFVCQILRVFTAKVSEDEEGAMDTICNANEEAAMKKEKLWEADIKYTPEQFEWMKGNQKNRQRRDLIKNTRFRWPNNVVNYVLSPDYTAAQASIIRESLDVLESRTCVRFQRFKLGKAPQDYIDVRKESGCFSYIGRVGGNQTLSLANGCLVERVIIHEFVHALGFFHEQSRPDRDTYIQVFLDRVQKGSESNFDKQPENRIDSLNSPYDPISIMHYTARTFANSDLPTMVWKENPDQRLGGSELSAEDVNQINGFYNCPQATTTTATPTTATTTATTTITTTTITAGTTASIPSTETTSTTTTSSTTAASATSTDEPNTLTSTVIPSQVCRDQFSQCSIYSGFCYILQDVCPETCGQCDCLKRAPDTRSECSSWIASGFCTHTVYGAFVRSTCSRGCCEHETPGLV